MLLTLWLLLKKKRKEKKRKCSEFSKTTLESVGKKEKTQQKSQKNLLQISKLTFVSQNSFSKTTKPLSY